MMEAPRHISWRHLGTYDGGTLDIYHGGALGRHGQERKEPLWSCRKERHKQRGLIHLVKDGRSRHILGASVENIMPPSLAGPSVESSLDLRVHLPVSASD